MGQERMTLQEWARKLVDLCNELNEHIASTPGGESGPSKTESVVNSIEITPRDVTIDLFQRNMSGVKLHWVNTPLGILDYISGKPGSKKMIVDNIVNAIEFAQKHNSDYYEAQRYAVIRTILDCKD